MMNYKGYVGAVEYDDEAKIFSGEVINTRTVITFQGTTVDELENEFHASVDDYLEWCEEDGIEPEKPYSGKFNVRISPLFHSQIAVAAKKLNMSLNSFVEKSLQDEMKKTVEVILLSLMMKEIWFLLKSKELKKDIEHRKEAFEFQAIRYVSKNVS